MATANVSNGEQDFQTEHVRVTFRYSTTPRRPRSTDPARDTVNGHGAAAHDGAPHTSCQAAKVYTSGGMRLFHPNVPFNPRQQLSSCLISACICALYAGLASSQILLYGTKERYLVIHLSDNDAKCCCGLQKFWPE